MADLRSMLTNLINPSAARGSGNPQSFEELMAITHGDRDSAARRWNIQHGRGNSTAYSPSWEQPAAPAVDPMITGAPGPGGGVPIPTPSPGAGGADVPIPTPRPADPLLEDRLTRERPPGPWDLPVSPRRPPDPMAASAPTNNPPPPLEIAPSPYRGPDPLAASAPTNNPPPPLEIAPSPFRGPDPMAASAPTEIGAAKAAEQGRKLKKKQQKKKSPGVERKSGQYSLPKIW